ncbi:hypothetical protein VZT92_021960 [Zoarces viviparus]|uniref:Uncharacterized protein n=1 Tax=Zoarces viviparus TaxID=48416 RepID=A0AAW1EC25_ZOAVI
MYPLEYQKKKEEKLRTSTAAASESRDSIKNDTTSPPTLCSSDTRDWKSSTVKDVDTEPPVLQSRRIKTSDA